jgi:hypothetical protein
MTYFYKRVFPIVWFGFIGLWTVVALGAIAAKGQPPFQLAYIFVGPAVMVVIGYILMRALVFDLVDVAYLDQGHIFVTNGDVKQQIALKDIINVNNTYLVNPERITLTTRNPGPLGREVTFMAPVRLWPFGRHTLANELTLLAANARDASLPLNELQQ